MKLAAMRKASLNELVKLHEKLKTYKQPSKKLADIIYSCGSQIVLNGSSHI